MEHRLAIVGIVVDNPDSVEELNRILHDYGDYIIGRTGIPYRKRKISLVTVTMDAPQNAISALAGKAGGLPGVTVSTLYSKVVLHDADC